jgi:hypothetical protein
MGQNVVGLFENRVDAEAVLVELCDANVPASDISFIGNNTSDDYSLSSRRLRTLL